MYSIIARLKPGNEVRITWYQSKTPKNDPFLQNATVENNPPVNPIPAIGSNALPGLSDPPLTSCLDLRVDKPQEGSNPVRNRAVPFTRRKAADIKTRLEALGTVANPKECVMLTGTLPGSTMAAMETIAKLAPEIVKKIREWVRYRSHSTYWLYTWEWQKRGALHIHYVVHEPDPEKRAALVAGWKAKWIEILLSFGDDTSLCLFARTNGKSWLEDTDKVQADAVELDKSPARYLSKYLSKSKYGTNGESLGFYPSQWSGCSRELLRLTESLTITIRTTHMPMGRTMLKLERLEHLMKTTEGTEKKYTHRGELFGTHIKYAANQEEKDSLWSEIEAELSDALDVRKSPPPAEPPPLTEAQIEWRHRRDASLKRLADRATQSLSERLHEKYDYLGLRWMPVPEAVINSGNANAITTESVDKVETETGTPMGTVPVPSIDPQRMQLTIW